MLEVYYLECWVEGHDCCQWLRSFPDNQEANDRRQKEEETRGRLTLQPNPARSEHAHLRRV